MAQIRDYLITGEKPPLRALRAHPCCAGSTRVPAHRRIACCCAGWGFDAATVSGCSAERPPGRSRDFGARARLVRARAARRAAAQGRRRHLRWNAVYSTRDLLRRSFHCACSNGPRRPPAREILDLALSTLRHAAAIGGPRRIAARSAARFGRAYLALIEGRGPARRPSRATAERAFSACGPRPAAPRPRPQPAPPREGYREAAPYCPAHIDR